MMPKRFWNAKNYYTIFGEEAIDEWRKMGIRTRKNRHFTLKQRKTLLLSWERGFLYDHKNYELLSKITGLTRKQISNWARRKRKIAKTLNQ